MRVKYQIDFDGLIEEDEIVVCDDATNEEIEDEVKEAVMNLLSYEWQIVKEDK